MGRKRPVFLLSSRHWLARFLLILITVFLCLLTSPILATIPSSEISTESLIQQGKTLYQAGQFERAVIVLQRAADAFKSAGDGQNLAMTLSNLALVYQQLGQWEQAEKAIAQSLNLLPREPTPILAQTLQVRGRLQLARGQAQAALNTWQQTADIYTQINDRSGEIRSRLNQAQAWQVLGLYRQAQARRLRSSQAIAEALLALGNTSRTQQDKKAALKFYQQAASESPSALARIQAEISQLSLLVEEQQIEPALALQARIQSQINSLPPDRTAINARIYFAQSSMRLKQNKSLEIVKLLTTTVQQAEKVGDKRGKSSALGTLGKLYEQNQSLSEALSFTEQALSIAQAIDAPELTYQWQWQLGRLLKNRGDRQGAIAAYSGAVTNLQSLRNDLVAIHPDVQFSFQEEVEPVYRQLVDLLLTKEGNREVSQDNILQARNTIELLQLAELNNFLRSVCLEAKIEIDRLVDRNGKAAVIYPIILSDRLEVIVKLPQQKLRHYATSLSQSQVESILEQLRQNLTQPDTVKEAKFFAQQVYNWTIEPIAGDLVQSKIETLVFVLDGYLRNIPMNALYNGKQYLVEKYNIALAPGLQLIDPQPLQRKPLKAIAAGITEPRSGFSGLKYVAQELKQIRAEMPSQELLNEQFTTQALQNQIASQPWTIVHLATHGQFSSKADRTFILAWDKPIEVNEFRSLLQTREQNQPRAIELLVLSACQTAVGDKQAALGLAGVAIRAGARRTIASLWYIDDASTSLLMSKFYQELVDRQLPPAEALRRAQIALMQDPQYKSPLFWAAFVLVGNWL